MMAAVMSKARRGVYGALAMVLWTTLFAAQQSSSAQSDPQSANPPATQQQSPPTQQQNPQAMQPPPFTAPNPPTPDAAHAPGQTPGVPQQQPQPAPNAPLPRPDRSTVDWRTLAPLAPEPPRPAQPSSSILHAEDESALPKAETPLQSRMHLFDLIGAYHPPRIPALPMYSPFPLDGLVKDGKLYLSLHDAIILAIQNNLDVEVSRYNLLAADTDVKRAKGGGTLRGLDYTVTQMAPGVGAQTSPLLVTASTTGTASPTSINVTDLSQITQIGNSPADNLSENGVSTYSPGPNIPLFDPVVTGEAGYFRRSDQTSLENTDGAGSTGTGDTGTGSTGTSAVADFISAGIDYQQGFSSGAQLDAYSDNSAQVLYAGDSQWNPAHAPSVSLTLTQPLLRGRGREVNLRFVRIAQLDRKVSRLLFEQQLLETAYGISRLYFDLVSLGENVAVKQDALDAAQKLYDDDKQQADEGTLAPIELMRVQALLSSSRLDLIQAEGEYRQQEVILREQLVRTLAGPGSDFVSIIPTDTIHVPDTPPALDTGTLIKDALNNRPDLVQASIEVQADEVTARAARNNVKPLLNIYGNVQTRGSSLVPYTLPGSPGTGVATVPPALSEGGLKLSTIYQGGIQLNMPLRNRIAQADSARDAIQLRQAQGRTAKLENDIRQQIENSTIALETAHQAYAAAVESSNYQAQLLQAEKDKFAVGESTNYLIVQDEAYLAQARSTEVAARSDWMKAQLALDRSLGSLLEKNNIELDQAIEDPSGHP
jgi:outer membrane protein TolC